MPNDATGPSTPLEPLQRSEPDSYLCELLVLREHLTSGEYLRDALYTEDSSRFAGSTYNYSVEVALPADRNVTQDRIAKDVSDACGSLHQEVLALIQAFSARMPSRVMTLVTLPPSVPAESSVQECLSRSRGAIVQSLCAKAPIAWLFAKIRAAARIHCQSEQYPKILECNPAQRFSLLRNTFDTGLAKARSRFPEVWNAEECDFALDSRGAQFAMDFVSELQAAGSLRHGTSFLDIGSGIGTMVSTVASFSDAKCTGVEIHPGLHRQALCHRQRLRRHGAIAQEQVSLICGDALDPEFDFRPFDLLYLYSPLGKSSIPVDPIAKRMREGAILISAKLPEEHLNLVSIQPEICGLSSMRRVS